MVRKLLKKFLATLKIDINKFKKYVSSNQHHKYEVILHHLFTYIRQT